MRAVVVIGRVRQEAIALRFDQRRTASAGHAFARPGCCTVDRGAAVIDDLIAI
jgi:hypothetical protein